MSREADAGNAMGLVRRILAIGFVQDALLIAAATILSVARTGYSFPGANNYFHLPIITELYENNNFSTDQFIQSMRHYASGFWWATGSVWSIHYIEEIFFVFFIISRLLIISVFLSWANVFGFFSLRDKAFFLVFMIFSPIVNGFSAAGGGGLLINYFTQSELANVSLLFSIALSARGRFATAIGMNGLTFFLNAFMAVWACVPIIGCLIYYLISQPANSTAVLKQILIGSLIFIPLASPVVYMILSNPDFGRPVDFDFRDYLYFYYPAHFLIGGVSIRGIISLIVFMISGIIAVVALGRKNNGAVFCGIALLCFIFIWFVGVVLPVFTGNQNLLKLHLLRSSTGIHLLAALALSALLVVWTGRAASDRQHSWAPALAIASETFRFATPLILLIVPLSHFFGFPKFFLQAKSGAAVIVLLVFVVWPLQITNTFRAQMAGEAEATNWREIAAWAQQNTAESAVFLLPVNSWDPPEGEPVLREPILFETLSERRVWVTFRSGAAVLWSPSFHSVWRARVTEVMGLHDLAARLQYARASGIDYVVDTCDDSAGAIYRSGPGCVYVTTNEQRP